MSYHEAYNDYDDYDNRDKYDGDLYDRELQLKDEEIAELKSQMARLEDRREVKPISVYRLGRLIRTTSRQQLMASGVDPYKPLAGIPKLYGDDLESKDRLIAALKSRIAALRAQLAEEIFLEERTPPSLDIIKTSTKL